MHEVQVNIVHSERFQRRVNSLLDSLVPWVVELGSKPDFFAGNARVLDSSTDLCLIAVRKLCSR
jgi:hypothetical protein